MRERWKLARVGLVVCVVVLGTLFDAGRASSTSTSADLLIKATSDADSHFLGDDVINQTGDSQTRTLRRSVGTSAKFIVKLENDCNCQQTYYFYGCSNSNGFKLTYLLLDPPNPPVDHTSDVESGGLSTGLLNGPPNNGSAEIEMIIKVTRRARGSKACDVWATVSPAGGTIVDLVRGVAKIKL